MVYGIAVEWACMIEFIESPLFSRLVDAYLSDEEFAALQWELVTHPEAGDLIPQSGGLRKLRWAAKGRGKRGGYRVIYYWRSRQGQIWLLTIYAKNEAENIPAHVLRTIKEALDHE
ncbi:MAG: type II toxin-antitoxin system RelE/ParE family toxin [Pseudomonadota bacterium]